MNEGFPRNVRKWPKISACLSAGTFFKTKQVKQCRWTVFKGDRVWPKGAVGTRPFSKVSSHPDSHSHCSQCSMLRCNCNPPPPMASQWFGPMLFHNSLLKTKHVRDILLPISRIKHIYHQFWKQVFRFWSLSNCESILRMNSGVVLLQRSYTSCPLWRH